jgi:hypothetical protein
MNFKTTVVLIIVLAVAAGVMFFTREKSGEAPKTAEQKQRIFAELKPEDVTKIVVTPSEGPRTVLEKTTAVWRMIEPVNAGAEAFEVDGLVRQVVELQSLGKVQTSGADAGATGLTSPHYTIEMTDKAGKSYRLLVGEKSPVGDSLYVSTAGPGEAQVVAADLLEHLEKPASTYRDPKLVNVPTSEVKQLTLKHGDSTIVLVKSGDDWKMIQPKSMPAEKSMVDDIVFGLTGLRAVDFVSEDSKDAALYDLKTPKVSAILSTQPATQPATQAIAGAAATAPATQPVEIRFGRYDDVLKKNIFASSSQTPAVAKVAASILETLDKKPIELRDKRVVDINADEVSRIEITSDLKATTKPTSRPASKTTVVLERHKGPALPIGIAAPTTTASATTTPALAAPAATSALAKTQATTVASAQRTSGASTQAATQTSTAPATTTAVTSTAPATKPAAAATQPATKWEIVEADQRHPANDSKIDALLSQLHPLRVEKYLENPPATQPTATYTLSITTAGPGGTPVNQYTLRLIDPGNSQSLRGDYNGLGFEANRTLLDHLSGDFTKRAGASTPEPGALPNEQNAEPTGP